jgi:hypothetical protein
MIIRMPAAAADEIAFSLFPLSSLEYKLDAVQGLVAYLSRYREAKGT